MSVEIDIGEGIIRDQQIGIDTNRFLELNSSLVVALQFDIDTPQVVVRCPKIGIKLQ